MVLLLIFAFLAGIFTVLSACILSILLVILLDGQPVGLVDISYDRHQLSIKIPQGIRAYSFTFGHQG